MMNIQNIKNQHLIKPIKRSQAINKDKKDKQLIQRQLEDGKGTKFDKRI